MARLPYRPTRASGKGRGPRVTREQRDAAVAPTKHGKVTSHLDTSRRMAEERAMSGPAYASATRPKGNPNPIIVSGWLIGTDGGTVFGYRPLAFGDLDPDTGLGLTVIELTVDTATGAVVLQFQGNVKAPADAILINADNNTTVVYWNGTDRYETTDSAFATAIAAELDNRIPVAFTNSGYVALSWNTIPNQVFRTNVPRSVDFRTFLNGTNKATATITAGDAWPAGFTYTNGLLEWDGTGSVNAGSEQSNIASDGLGPDIESALFTYTVEAYTALSWDPIPDNVFTFGTPGSFDLRTFLNGTNAATAAIALNQQLPPGLSLANGVINYSGLTDFDVSGLVATAGDGIGSNADSAPFGLSTDYVALSWSGIINWQPIQNGTPQQLDIRAELSGTNAATAEISEILGEVSTLPVRDGYEWDGSVLTYDGVGQIPLDLDISASDGVGPDAITALIVFPVLNVELVPQSFTISEKNGTLDSRDPNYLNQAGQLSLQSSYNVNDNGSRNFQIQRSNGAAGAVAVTVTVTGPNASDFTPQTDTANFADGQVTANFTATIADLGGAGSATLTLSNPTNGASLGNASASVNISNTTGLVHGQSFSVNGSGFGTRPDYNVYNLTWQGQRHIHYAWTDFANDWPADGSSINQYRQAHGGFVPTTFFSLYTSPNANSSMSLQAGGPSRSGRFFRTTDRAYYMAASIGSGDAPSSVPAVGYARFKQRHVDNGKSVRFWKNGTGPGGPPNWYWATTAVTREYNQPFTKYGYTRVSAVNFDLTEFEFYADGQGRMIRDGVPQVPSGGDAGTGYPGPRPTMPFMAGTNWQNSWWAIPDSVIDGGPVDSTDFYLDFTLARVVIEQGNKIEVQILTSWSNTAINGVFNQGELVSGPATLKVYDSGNNVVRTEQVEVA